MGLASVKCGRKKFILKLRSNIVWFLYGEGLWYSRRRPMSVMVGKKWQGKKDKEGIRRKKNKKILPLSGYFL